MLARLLLTTAMPALLLAQTLDPLPPHSGFEPPAAEKAASIAESIKAAPREFLTVAETSDFKATGRYDESLALYHKFAAASPFAKLLTLGTTPEGREIVILGNNLSSTTAVSFNGTPATFQILSDTLVRATVPTGATTGTIQLTNSSGTLSTKVPFIVR